MRVMPGMSAGVAARIVTSGMPGIVAKVEKKTPRRGAGAWISREVCFGLTPCYGLAPVADQAQQHHEQVDEVEVERQRAHHGLAAERAVVIHRAVHLLDALGIV